MNAWHVAAGICLSSLQLAAVLWAADPSDAPAGAAHIRLSGCRIVLIDQVTLACDRPGVLRMIEYKEGQRVSAGQEVARIGDEVARANLAVAEKKAANDVDVRFSRSASELADAEYRKNVAANQKSVDSSGRPLIVVPLLEIEKLKLAAEKGKLAIEQAEHEFALSKLNAEVAKVERDTYSVIAVFDGVVTQVFKRRGEAVRQGDPIVEIVNTDRVRVEGRIGLSDLRFVRQRTRVKVRLTVPDLDLPEEREEFEGHVTFVDLVSDPITHETRVFAEVQNRENILRAGLTADMVLDRKEPGESKSRPPADR